MGCAVVARAFGGCCAVVASRGLAALFVLVFVCVCVCVCVRVCVCVCVCIIYLRKYYVFMCVCVCVHVHTYIYICICIHMDIRKHSVFSQSFSTCFISCTAEEVRISQEVNSKYCLRTFEFVVNFFQHPTLHPFLVLLYTSTPRPNLPYFRFFFVGAGGPLRACDGVGGWRRTF